ncbi:MAG TPA: hypothetical protein VFT31_06590 [Kribbella sp.]|nr:hypothetical protein [Kribbella sp.]
MSSARGFGAVLADAQAGRPLPGEQVVEAWRARRAEADVADRVGLLRSTAPE